MRTIATVLNGYRASRGVYPPSIEVLVAEKSLERVFGDAWKHPFIYSVPGSAGQPFALISLGPDGAQGTDDDIDWWRVEQE